MVKPKPQVPQHDLFAALRRPRAVMVVAVLLALAVILLVLAFSSTSSTKPIKYTPSTTTLPPSYVKGKVRVFPDANPCIVNPDSTPTIASLATYGHSCLASQLNTEVEAVVNDLFASRNTIPSSPPGETNPSCPTALADFAKAITTPPPHGTSYVSAASNTVIVVCGQKDSNVLIKGLSRWAN